ncbi:type I pullulanase [Gaoshiqia sediminis]|uniref:Type I pullulanase n=1 Tax=Gaoshiqia sediminis TaxID=2986998 RepID=A0AA41Y6Z5_9BACT|nr:type I pullulanase [Gaoshiqia sediminis]MCW0482621.1 type I pullulanase [Gaoshiqia sediminis]
MRNWKFNHIDFSTFPFYGGNDLGVFLTEKGASIKIWTPTAQAVQFLVYRQSHGGTPIRIDELVPSEQGCWKLELDGDLAGLYYTFRVNDGDWLNETPGVDARAVGGNGKRGLFFRPEETNPEGWESDKPVVLENPVDAILYELHIRDFSIAPGSGMTNKGKYSAFMEAETRSPEGLATGISHLKELGITHVHLLPVADFFSVDELHPNEKYNWGYDPLNYNTPEGSYATNPENTSRITEFKQLVLSLHDAGIGVVMDVVYNHTGYTRRSWFNQTVPGYYYRQNRSGGFSNASGCGNEIASERAMVRKFMVDSVCYWATEFHIDGFRFDLMGIHDTQTMNEIRAALDLLRPGILIYGEGWTADQSPLAEQYRAVKANVSQLDRVACFNDDFRDALKGNNFDGNGKGFVNGKTLHEEAIKFGIAAACYHPQIVYSYVESSSYAWAQEPWQCVNYVSCHDNYTLFDKLKQSCPEVAPERIKRMHMLAVALVLTSQGIPFLHAGVEFCRTKYGNHNSYKSPDKINQLDWSRKKEYQDVFLYIKKLIELRKSFPGFRLRSASDIHRHLIFSPVYQVGVVSYGLDCVVNEYDWRSMQLIFNARETEVEVELPQNGHWTILALEDLIDLRGMQRLETNTVSVPPVSMMILAH